MSIGTHCPVWHSYLAVGGGGGGDGEGGGGGGGGGGGDGGGDAGGGDGTRSVAVVIPSADGICVQLRAQPSPSFWNTRTKSPLSLCCTRNRHEALPTATSKKWTESEGSPASLAYTCGPRHVRSVRRLAHEWVGLSISQRTTWRLGSMHHSKPEPPTPVL